jgi:hypothetical protein
MEAVQNLPAHQQQAFMKELESMQVKDSLSYVVVSHMNRTCHLFLGPLGARAVREYLARSEEET